MKRQCKGKRGLKKVKLVLDLELGSQPPVFCRVVSCHKVAGGNRANLQCHLTEILTFENVYMGHKRIGEKNEDANLKLFTTV